MRAQCVFAFTFYIRVLYNKIMKNEFLDLIEGDNLDELISRLEDGTPEELLSELSRLDDATLEAVCKKLSPDCIAEALPDASAEQQGRIISALGDYDLREVMDEVSVEDTVDIIEALHEDVAKRIAEEEEIVALVEEKSFCVLKPLLHEKNPVDLALILEEIPRHDLPIIFRLLSKEQAAETFVEMDSELQEYLIGKITDSELKAVLDEIYLDDAVDIIEEMPANVVKRIIAQSDHETRNYINELLKYPESSAGSVMTVEFVSLKENMTVKQAFDRIRETAIDKETVYTCYITDDKKKLIGVISAKKLMLASKDAKIGDLMNDNVIYADTHTDKEEVASMISKYGLIALPIVDSEERLVGIVTFDDAMDIAEEATTADFAKIGGVTPTSEPYLKTSVWRIWRSRAPWLLLMMITATFTGLVITNYEHALAVSIALTASIPMLMDTAGNAGTQVAVTLVRSMALNELKFSDFFKAMWKEFRVSILLGATLSVVCFAKVLTVDKLAWMPNGWWVAGVISITLFITVVLSKIIGTALPLLAKKMRLDPAAMASTTITAIVDILALIIYCNIAIVMLRPLGVM